MFLCLCQCVKKSDVQQLGRLGVITPEALTTALKLDDDDCCGRCADNIEEFVDVARAEWVTIAPRPAKHLVDAFL